MTDKIEPEIVTNNQILFLHVPKTAGTSLRYHYRDNLPNGSFFNCYTYESEIEEKYDRLLDALKSDKELALKDIKIIHGHDAHTLKAYLPDFHLASVIRDPVERLLSYYNYRKYAIISDTNPHKEDSQREQKELNADPNSLMNYITDNKSNIQSKFLCNALDIEIKGDVENAHADAILHKLPLIGLTEKLEAFNFLMSHRFQLPLAPIQPKNVAAQRQTEFVAKRTREAISSITKVDQYLYDNAEERFDHMFVELFAGGGNYLPSMGKAPHRLF